MVLAVLTGIYVHKNHKLKQEDEKLPGYHLSIQNTWNSQPITNHDPVNITLDWKESELGIMMTLEAPFFNNPAPNHTAGVVADLFRYEVVELFIANDKQQYIEIEIGPYNHHLCILFDGLKNTINSGYYLTLSVWNQFSKNNTHWSGQALIPLAYLPTNISSLNAYHIYKYGTTKFYEALSPTPYGEYSGPDFHRLQYFQDIDGSRLIPKKFDNKNKPYVDWRYGDLWAGHY